MIKAFRASIFKTSCLGTYCEGPFNNHVSPTPYFLLLSSNGITASNKNDQYVYKIGQTE
jgi:hypothetical protein